MTSMPLHEFRQHMQHAWMVKSTDHIHNVPEVETEFLMDCSCGFYGWVPKIRLTEVRERKE